jgi:hypothetical protein
MKNLYIDFDGVIVDTITPLYAALELEGIDKLDEIHSREFYRRFDWHKLLIETPPLNDSIECIKKLMNSDKYDVAILTHVNSTKEAIEKIDFLHRYFDDISIVIVPREASKTSVVHVKGAILVDDYSGNLDDWQSKGGIPIRFNQELEAHGYPVINKLDQLLSMDL